MPPIILDYTKLSLAEAVTEAEAVTRDAQTAFGQLTAEQLNWKPSAAAWSVGQCLEHLIAANRQMFPAFDEVLEGRKQTSLWERVPLLPGLCGRVMVKSQAPEATRKFKAPPAAQPSASAIDAGVVSHFTAHQREVVGRLQEMEKYEADRIIITSPFVRLITYSMLDACRLLVTHERRHLAQAQRVTKLPGFPSAGHS